MIAQTTLTSSASACTVQIPLWLVALIAAVVIMALVTVVIGMRR